MGQVEQIPTVFVIAGPNGAGKTTFASEFLPDFVSCRQFLNADLIASGLSPFAPETQNMRAGRLLLERIEELSAARENFGFETTLSGRTYVRLLAGLRRLEYRVVLFFLWLPDTELALVRVANRVRQGGHGVPEADVKAIQIRTCQFPPSVLPHCGRVVSLRRFSEPAVADRSAGRRYHYGEASGP